MSEYKLVPVEPTEEMVYEAAWNTELGVFSPDYCKAIYKAMLEAAPTNPTEISGTLVDELRGLIKQMRNIRITEAYKDTAWWWADELDALMERTANESE